MQARFREPGPVRRRLLVTGMLELTSQTHLGGVDASIVTDAPIARDPDDGTPILYGATLAGLLRRALLDRIGGMRRGERRDETDTLFGNADETGGQSAFTVDDSLAEGVGTSVRDSVRIDGDSGVAADGAKFDMEVLDPGTRFPISLELALGPDEAENRIRWSHLATCLDALERGEVRLGSRTRKGFGRCGVVLDEGDRSRWSIREFDLGSRAGVASWIVCPEPGPALPRPRSRTRPDELPPPAALRVHDAASLAKQLSVEILPQPGETFEVEAVLSVASSVLVGAAALDPNAADVTQFERRGAGGRPEPVVPGTSLGGVLRGRARRIARTVLGKLEAQHLIEGMFGTVEGAPRAGYLEVSDATIERGQKLRHTRVGIDRWTGGALEHVLFEEDAVFGGALDVRVRLCLGGREDGPAMVGLLLCAFKDLYTGDLPVGGKSSIGRGRLLGMGGIVRHTSGHRATAEEWTLLPAKDGRGLELASGDAGQLQKWVDALHKFTTQGSTAPNAPGTSVGREGGA